MTAQDTIFTPYSQIANGSVFYVAKHPGNCYRKLDDKTAEFTVHRLGSKYVGCQIMMGPSCHVLKQPLTPDELELLGVDPDVNPFSSTYQMPEGYDLLNTNNKEHEDLLN